MEDSLRNRPWYRLDDEDAIFDIGDPNKAVYRFVPFDVLLQMFNEEKIVLVKTASWEDVYENFIFKENVRCKGKDVVLSRAAGLLYGQCWTFKMSSDAMWRIYSPDKKSVRIKTTVKKLDQIEPDEKHSGVLVCGKVRYYPQPIIEEDIRTLPTLTKDEFLTLSIQSLFVKRNSFSHESEFRLVYVADEKSESTVDNVKSFSINPHELIESVMFDPRATDDYVERCTKILVDVFSFPARKIRKSSLYLFNRQEIDYTD